MRSFKFFSRCVAVAFLSVCSTGAWAGKVYFDNTSSRWATPTVYYWGGSTAVVPAFPGTGMTVYQGNIWVYDAIPDDATNVIFSGGGSVAEAQKTQTKDLVFADGHVFTPDGVDHGDIADYVIVDPGPEPDPDPETPCYWITPAGATSADEVTLHFDASKDSKTLMGRSEVYAYVGVTLEGQGNTWNHAPQSWNDLPDKYLMVRDSDNPNLYTLTFSPDVDTWFGVDMDEAVTGLAVIFRDKGGTKHHSSDQFIKLAASPVNPSLSPLGAFVSAADNDGTVVVTAEKGRLFITPYAPDVVKIFTLRNGDDSAERRSIAVCAAPQASYSVSESDDAYTVAVTDGVSVVVDKASCLVTFVDNEGDKVLAEHRGLVNGAGNCTISFEGMGDDAFYGGGYNGGWTNWDGHSMVMNNTQTGSWVASTPPPHNINIPFYVSTNGYGVLVDDVYLGATISPSKDGSTYRSGSSSPVAYYFVGGGSMERVMQNYAGLTGHQDLPPFWAMGYITSRYGYHSESEARQVISNIKNIGIPLDGIVFDLYWQGQSESGMGNLDWYRANFPDPEGMMADFKAMGVNTVCITEPFFSSSCANYGTLKNSGYLADDDVANMNWVAPKVGLLDATNPDALAWMSDFYAARTREGMAGWWLDLGEPERHDRDSHHQGGTYDEIHNEFGNLWVESVYNRLRRDFPDMRHLIMPRAATAGIQRFSAFPWTGDIRRSWDGLQAQVPALVNGSMSGMGFLGSDIGGFIANGTDANLYLRWVELAVFYPVMRTHSSVYPEPYNSCYDAVRDDVRRFVKLRYSYLPYSYSMAYEYSRYGIPMARPANFADVDHSTLADCRDAYLWGRDIFVAPVLTANTSSRTITFPEGRWLDLNDYTSEYEGGSTVTYSAPLGVLPHFARQGSFIPRYAQEDYTNTSSIDKSRLTVDYYVNPTPTPDGSIMYDDDNVSHDPVSTGDYILTHFTGYMANDNNIVVNITRRGNGYAGMPESQEVLMTLHGYTLTDNGSVGLVPAGGSVSRAAADGHMSRYDDLESLKGAPGDGYAATADKVYVKMSLSPKADYAVNINKTEVTGIGSPALSGTVSLAYADGVISYSAPEGASACSVEVYTATGMRMAVYDGLPCRGTISQIPVSLAPGVYVGVLYVYGRKSVTAKMMVK